jgi:hypothetical protein
MSQFPDYAANAESAAEARQIINRCFADPGSDDAHWARAAAAVAIHGGATLEEAVAAAVGGE